MTDDDLFSAQNEQAQTDDSDYVEKSPEGDTFEKPQPNEGEAMSEADKRLLAKIQRTIKADRQHFSKDFERMRRDMRIARVGHDRDWPEKNYKANITGRHIRQKVNALYAKNPKAIARRRETLDFQIWDETSTSLMVALQTMQQVQMAATAAQAGVATGGVDPATGAPMPEPQLPPGFEQAQGVLADFQAGMQRRDAIKKIGKTLEVLFAQAVKEQKPVDFKTAMKKVVRRACTTGVGYVKVGFQRQMGPRQGLQEQLADAQERLAHLQRLMEERSEEDHNDPDDPEIAELQHTIQALQSEPEIVLREGLTFSYPGATKVIPDRNCTSLVGFEDARHIAVEELYSKEEVEEIFGLDVGRYTEYLPNGQKVEGAPQGELFDQDSDDSHGDRSGLVCVWEHYDRPSGLVYYVADGVEKWLRPPAPPDVRVSDFWPVYGLTFNEVESEDKLFPPSDVSLILDIQNEYNRSRHGKREHRKAGRPRFATRAGAIEDEDQKKLTNAEPFSVIPLNIGPDEDIRKLLAPVPVPGVDPNLYDVGEIMSDLQYVVGTQQAMLGGVSKASATESSIAAASSAATDQSSIDDLDGFLTRIANAAGEIMLGEMSEEQVMKIAGAGAFWPQQTISEIMEDIYLEVEAGSSGKPNQAVQVQNFKTIGPLLMQIPSINKEWLAKYAVQVLDDKIDLTEAIASNAASIVQQNRTPPTGQAGPPGAGGPPEAQGEHGEAPAAKQQAEEKPTGSDAHFGSNQV